MDKIPHQSDLIKTTFIVIGILLVLVIVAGIVLVTSKNYIILQPDSAIAFFKTNGEKDFVVLLNSQGIKYTPIHFDDWNLIP